MRNIVKRLDRRRFVGLRGLGGVRRPTPGRRREQRRAVAGPKKPARVSLPTVNVNKDKAEQCVEPTEATRRDHMKMILHQRDDTMYQGIRTVKHSLKTA